MKKNYDYYKRMFNLDKDTVDEYMTIIDDVGLGDIDVEGIKDGGINLLKMCICEEKYDVLEKLIKPIKIIDSSKYLTNGSFGDEGRELVNYIYSLPYLEEKEITLKLLSASKFNSPLAIEMKEHPEDVFYVDEETKNNLLNLCNYKSHLDLIGNVKIKDADKVFSEYHNNISVAGASVVDYLDSLNISASSYLIDNGRNSYSSAIMFDYEQLNDDNKEEVSSLVEDGFAHIAKVKGEKDKVLIALDCNGDEYVEDLDNDLKEIVGYLTIQDVYGYRTIDKRYEMYFGDNEFYEDTFSTEERNKLDPLINSDKKKEAVVEALSSGMFTDVYDEESGLVWNNEDQLRRHNNYVKAQSEKKLVKDK